MYAKDVPAALKAVTWCDVGNGIKACEVGPWTFYRHSDGHASVAESDCWVSALFASVDDAATWCDHMIEAEQKFRAMNVGKPDGVRDYVQARTA